MHLIRPLLMFLCAAAAWSADPAERVHYQPPTWQPRGILPAAVALKGDFCPPSPVVPVDYADPGFDDSRLSPVPAPGVHPRVVVTPEDVERIRAKVALGDQAPAAFRVQWARAVESRSAFYALVARDDALGRELAAGLVARIASLEPKLDTIDRQPDHDNLWAVERSLVASGDPDPPSEIWSLLDYDYLHAWMTPTQREAAQRVITRLTAGRISNFMAYPDHFMINNHQGFGMEFIRLLLLIEGQDGFDQQVFGHAAHKARAMLDWYLSKDGMCYESIKGWLNVSAFTAVGLRQRDLLKHEHLRAKMAFFRAALRWEAGTWQIRDEMRASAFHVIWMMHYYHPRDEAIDLLYRATFTSHPFLVDAKARWPNPVGIVPELLLLYADDGILGSDGKPLDWTDQSRLDRLKLPVTWRDDVRGYIDARNTWRKDDLRVGFTCKQDFFYGGHEGSENNRITLWKDGVNWIQDLNMLATKATALQNMATIDGKGLKWPPVPGVWLGAVDSPIGMTAAGDGRMGYTYAKRMQVHPLNFPSAKIPYYAPFAEGNFDLTRDLQVAFHPGTVAWNDGYAHTDYGPWSGETRLVEQYQEWNPMRRAYRTVHLARGERPYVLVLDDLQKDEAQHLYEWNISLPPDSELYEAENPEVVFQNVDPSTRRDASFLLVTAASRDPLKGTLAPKKGDPACLVRVLWRNSAYGFPLPRFERFCGSAPVKYNGFAHLTVPAISASPEFRILVYPHRFGDPLPTTTWNADRSRLTVSIGDQLDRYSLASADGGRTVLAMERAGAPALTSGVAPARPVARLGGRACDPADRRSTREDGQPFARRFAGRSEAMFERVLPPAMIRCTTDGSEPDERSPLYDAPLPITTSCTVKARRFDPSWVCGPTASGTTTIVFIREEPLPGVAEPPADSRPGLLARIYELQTVMWNDRGFFDAGKAMMPDLDHAEPAYGTVTDGVAVPQTGPRRPMFDQAKGFYRWTGWFHAPTAGLYEFCVDSCGPLTLDLGQRAVIDHSGIFHQQQAVRRGEIALAAGWHALDLAVCDPQFWNASTQGLMPVSLAVRRDDGAEETVGVDRLRCRSEGLATAVEPTPIQHAGATDMPRLESGLVLRTYDREGLAMDPAYLDIDALTPLRTALVDSLVDNPRPGLVRVYEGWFRAPLAGLYGFELPRRRSENAGLGELRSAYQNQLRVDGEVVVQHGVSGRLPPGRISLGAGWHQLSLRLGSSPADLRITWPDGQTLPLSAGMWSRPRQVAILPAGQTALRSRYEIYAPTTVSLELPGEPGAVIRVTRDGSSPGMDSPIYDAPLAVDAHATLRATAFRDGRAITAPAQVEIRRVELPSDGLLAAVDASVWGTAPGGLHQLPGGAQAWIAPAARIDDGVLTVNANAAPAAGAAVDLNVSRTGPLPGLRLAGLRMRDNALTVALRVRSDGSGRLFGKDGITAFGKSYKTVGCRLERGQVQAEPGRLRGPKLTPGWHDVALSGDDRDVILYVDGKEVARAPGMPNLTTDSLDVLTDHPAGLGWIRVYDRVLEPADIARLSAAKRTP